MPSIFSRIVSGDIPAIRVYEDHATLAFMDINPAARGHALVIPKDEHADLFSIPPETLAAVARTVQRVALAMREVLRPDGVNIIQNNGAAAGQTVFHYHVHIIPRWEGDNALRLWKPQAADQADLRTLAEQLGQALAR
ncbi:MAG TPA: HIT family protein [Kouleothrix sp.]|uniref:HIT family protein n=1 Tax=Kouleothrix sp. TaxID=2779161 RepID=UPI002C8B9614|nr:HIT family protein [Kouleothrix sp.]HRC77164.1 HIT family protein [Kouleothrix sp.]